MNLVNYIKKHSEKIPFVMVCFFMVCYVCSFFDFYFYGYRIMQNICEVSYMFCIFMYGYSEKWSFIAQRSLYTLMALNTVNLIDEIKPLDNYYFDYIVIIYSFLVTLIISDKCKKYLNFLNG